MSRIHGTAKSIVAVTPSDSTILNCDMIYVGGDAGNLVVVTPTGQTVTIPVAATSYHLFEAKHIKAATTATSIFALYF